MNAVPTQNRQDFVVGLGATGLSVARFLKRHGQSAAFFDSRLQPPGLDELKAMWPDAELSLGDAVLPAGTGRVIASPGIEDRHPLLAAARADGIDVISDIQLFAENVTSPFVAITGSNGKSTVTTLVHEMCVAHGLESRAGGNLGEPALDLLQGPAPDVFVLELSSFQLQRTQTLPAAVAVLLNVTPDHLDWHGSEKHYRAAKYRIFREALGAVVNRDDADALQHAAHISHCLSFGLDAPAEGQYGLRQSAGQVYLARGDELLLATGEMALFGRHNQANALAALATGELLGLEMSAMLSVLRKFAGLPHRMQSVGEVDGVRFVNDSKATNVAAAVASIDSVQQATVLIAGGLGKGADYDDLAAACREYVHHAVLIGSDAQQIARSLQDVCPVTFATDLDAAVLHASSVATSGDVVLLAPACASFDQFTSYAARGDAFAAAVDRLRGAA